MTKHKLLINWFLLFIIILCLCLSLFFCFKVVRLQIAIILIILLLSFIFYPIYLLDKRISDNYDMEQIEAKSKRLKTRSIELEKVTKKGEIMETQLKSEILNLNNKGEENHNKIKIYCKFCGKKIVEDVKICPYCGTSL